MIIEEQQEVMNSTTINSSQAKAHVGSKRSRRLRSVGNSDVKQKRGRKVHAAKAADTSKGKEEPAVFLKKTYEMIDKCDNRLAEWTQDGEKFIIKDSEAFARDIIPQYFEHSNFGSFNRQLNFYGFRKVQTTPILRADIDRKKLKWTTFHHENFKRNRFDLLHNIQRSTRNGGQKASLKEQQKEITNLNTRVQSLEDTVKHLMQIIQSQDPSAPLAPMPSLQVHPDGLPSSHYDYAMNEAETKDENQSTPTLAPHPRAKGSLPREFTLSGALERGMSSISLLRGLSSDPMWQEDPKEI